MKQKDHSSDDSQFLARFRAFLIADLGVGPTNWLATPEEDIVRFDLRTASGDNPVALAIASPGTPVQVIWTRVDAPEEAPFIGEVICSQFSRAGRIDDIVTPTNFSLSADGGSTDDSELEDFAPPIAASSNRKKPKKDLDDSEIRIKFLGVPNGVELCDVTTQGPGKTLESTSVGVHDGNNEIEFPDADRENASNCKAHAQARCRKKKKPKEGNNQTKEHSGVQAGSKKKIETDTADYHRDSNWDLLESYLESGDQDAMTELYDRTIWLVMSVIMKAEIPEHIAENLSQDVFWRVSRIRKIERKARFTTMLYRIALNKAIDYKKRCLRQRVRFDSEIIELSSKEAGDTFINSLIREEEADEVRAMIDMLPTMQKTTVQCLMDGISIQEIAERRGVTPSTVRSQLARAQQRLREMIRLNGLSM